MQSGESSPPPRLQRSCHHRHGGCPHERLRPRRRHLRIIHLVDINYVAKSLSADDPRRHFRRDDRRPRRTRQSGVDGRAVRRLPDGLSEGGGAQHADGARPLRRQHRLPRLMGLGGSWSAWAFSGRRREPSASTSTKSAACCQPSNAGAVSFPSGVRLPTQATPPAASAAASSSGVWTKGYWGGRMMWVVVASSTVPQGRSSSASAYSRLVLPPLPITAVTPLVTPSIFHNSSTETPPFSPIIPCKRWCCNGKSG